MLCREARKAVSLPDSARFLVLGLACLAAGPVCPAAIVPATPEPAAGPSHSLEEEEGWLRLVQADLDEAEYRFSPAAVDAAGAPAAWGAPNRAHGFRITVDGDSLRLTPRVEGRTAWVLELASIDLGRGAAREPLDAAPPAAEGPTTERADTTPPPGGLAARAAPSRNKAATAQLPAPDPRRFARTGDPPESATPDPP